MYHMVCAPGSPVALLKFIYHQNHHSSMIQVMIRLRSQPASCALQQTVSTQIPTWSHNYFRSFFNYAQRLLPHHWTCSITYCTLEWYHNLNCKSVQGYIFILSPSSFTRGMSAPLQKPYSLQRLLRSQIFRRWTQNFSRVLRNKQWKRMLKARGAFHRAYKPAVPSQLQSTFKVAKLPAPFSTSSSHALRDSGTTSIIHCNNLFLGLILTSFPKMFLDELNLIPPEECATYVLGRGRSRTGVEMWSTHEIPNKQGGE